MAGLYGYEVSEERAVATVRRRVRQPDQLHRHLQRVRRGRRRRAADRARAAAPGRAAARRRAGHQGRPRPADGRLLRRPGARVDARRAWSGSASTTSSCCTCTTRSGSVRARPPRRAARSRRWSACATRASSSHLGVAGGPVALMQRYLDTGVFEVVLTHNRYTLLDRSAERAVPRPRTSAASACSTPRPTAAACCRRARTSSRSTPTASATTRFAAAARRDAGGVRAGQACRSRPPRCSSRCGRRSSTRRSSGSPRRSGSRQTLELATVVIPDEVWDELERFGSRPGALAGSAVKADHARRVNRPSRPGTVEAGRAVDRVDDGHVGDRIGSFGG